MEGAENEQPAVQPDAEVYRDGDWDSEPSQPHGETHVCHVDAVAGCKD